MRSALAPLRFARPLDISRTGCAPAGWSKGDDVFALTPNPGFVLILAALVAVAAPRGLGAPTIAGAALAALWMLLDRDFGAAAAMAQMGLPVILLDLDTLNRIFGIAMLIALIIGAAYSGGRRHRYEDAAILLLAGGSVSALFVGDLLSFVAAAAVAGLAAVWTTFSSPRPGASEAGARLLVWLGLEGLLFLIGVALQLAAGGGRSVLTHLSLNSLGGAFIFAALMIRVGAPLAHVWLKDVVSHASPLGGAALSAFTSMLGVYALARFFPAEPMLIAVGVGMMLTGAFFSAAESDLRRAAAYGLTAQTGVCVALTGVGSPLALAGAQAQAFAAIVAFFSLQLALGNVIERVGEVRTSGRGGFARAMPITTALLLISGLAVAGAPGLLLYGALTVALEATAQWELRGVWAIVAGVSAVLAITLFVRPTLAAFAPTPAREARFREAPFSMLLGAILATFFCIAIGVAPSWLFDLLPTELTFQPYAPDRLDRQIELLGAAGAVYLALRMASGARKTAPESAELMDVDTLYRGPLAAAGRWMGIVLLRFYSATRATSEAVVNRLGRRMGAWVARFDNPYRPVVSGGIALWAVGALLLIVLFWT